MKRPGKRSLSFGLGLAAMMLGAQPARASENGASFYLLGSGGPSAAILPPVRGIFFDNTYLHYRGHSDGTQQFVVGGSLVAGLRAKIDADFVTLLWVPSTDFAGGTLAIAGALPFGQVSADVDAVITGPRGRSVTISGGDSAFVVGDPVTTTSLSWKLGGNTHIETSAMINVPLGTYREDHFANLSFHRWIIDWSTALTWHDDKAGWDVSGKAGFTFNGTNHYTDYNTGTEFHLEGSVEHMFSKAFSLGIVGYYFDQVSGDSGPGARLGPFKGRVSALGGTAAYNFMAGRIPISLRTRVFKEFDARNRVDHGTSIFFSIDMPLHVIMPKAPAKSQ